MIVSCLSHCMYFSLYVVLMLIHPVCVITILLLSCRYDVASCQLLPCLECVLNCFRSGDKPSCYCSRHQSRTETSTRTCTYADTVARVSNSICKCSFNVEGNKQTGSVGMSHEIHVSDVCLVYLNVKSLLMTSNCSRFIMQGDFLSQVLL